MTGVSRHAGIGFAIGRRLLRDGHRALVHSCAAVDEEHGLAESAWVTGNVIDAEGGFRRRAGG